MSLSMQAEPLAPQTIAGGFVLLPVRQFLFAWRTCQRSPLGVGHFRTWLACRELLARRCTLENGRTPTYGFTELARLTGVSEKRVRSSVNHLIAAGLLSWSDQVIDFPDPELRSETTPDDDALTDTIGGGKGSIVIPRRILRLLVAGARPALIATVLAILLRCLSRGRGGFRSRGRLKASWIARVFAVDLRRVKQARKELIGMGWIAPEPTDQWAENSWGRVYHIDLGWNRALPLPDGRQLPPLPSAEGRRLPPPDLDLEPLREKKHQEPASGGPAGFPIQQATEEPPPSTPAPRSLAPPPVVGPALPVTTRLEPMSSTAVTAANGAGGLQARVEAVRPIPSRPAAVADKVGGGPLTAPRLNDVRVEDLKDTGRLLVLLEQAIARDLVGSSEADRLRFVAAAEHALGVGQENPPGLFSYLVRGGLWRYLTQEDEDRANARIKRELRGEPVIRTRTGSGLMAVWGELGPSADAKLVRGIRAALIRAGHYSDPYPTFARLNPGWTRQRWDDALVELGLPRSGIGGAGEPAEAGVRLNDPAA